MTLFSSPSPVRHKLVALPTLDGYELVLEESILYCEADGNYTRFYINNGESMLISRKLKDACSKLNQSWFIRTHQSFLVNLRHVKRFLRKDGGTLMMANGKNIPISRMKKGQVMECFMMV